MSVSFETLLKSKLIKFKVNIRFRIRINLRVLFQQNTQQQSVSEGENMVGRIHCRKMIQFIIASHFIHFNQSLNPKSRLSLSIIIDLP